MNKSATIIVEERLGRIKALARALECVAIRDDDLPGNACDTCGWLGILVHEEMDKLKAGLDFTVLNTPT